MANHRLYVMCDHCGDVHKTGIKIGMDDGPADVARLSDVYAGEELPPEVAEFKNNIFTCPKTGQQFTQKDNNQLFIIPVADD